MEQKKSVQRRGPCTASRSCHSRCWSVPCQAACASDQCTDSEQCRCITPIAKLRCAALPCITGLRPSSLTKAERLHFGARSADYLDARYHRSLLFVSVAPQCSSFELWCMCYRNSILQLWESQSQVYLSAKDCTGAYLHLPNRHLCHTCIDCLSYSTTAQAITASLLSA